MCSPPCLFPASHLLTHLPDLWPEGPVVPSRPFLGPVVPSWPEGPVVPLQAQRSLRGVAVSPSEPCVYSAGTIELTFSNGATWGGPSGPSAQPHIGQADCFPDVYSWELVCRPFCAKLSMDTTNYTSGEASVGRGRRRGKGEE